MQVPNINESGYYAGVVALKSYIDKFHSDLRVAIIDPVIDYFYLNPPDKESEFFQWFNTYANQGQFEHLYTFPQMHEIIEGFIFKYIDKTNPAFFGFSIIDGNIDASFAIAKKIKEKYPHIKILFGGNGIEVLDFGVLPNANYKTDTYNFIDVFSPFLWQWMLIYATIIVVVGQLCWLAGLMKATPSQLNLASLLNPILAIVMAYLILGEIPTLAQYLGGSLLLIGVILSFIGNSYQSKINRELNKSSAIEKMDTPIGFRGI
jgi:hypothetical protein